MHVCADLYDISQFMLQNDLWVYAVQNTMNNLSYPKPKMLVYLVNANLECGRAMPSLTELHYAKHFNLLGVEIPVCYAYPFFLL